MKFNLQKTVIHVFTIIEQWQQQADKIKELWKKTKIFECFQFWKFEMFSNSVQTLIVNQMHKINAIIEKNEL